MDDRKEIGDDAGNLSVVLHCQQGCVEVSLITRHQSNCPTVCSKMASVRLKVDLHSTINVLGHNWACRVHACNCKFTNIVLVVTFHQLYALYCILIFHHSDGAKHQWF
jgi:hypothetical protein